MLVVTRPRIKTSILPQQVVATIQQLHLPALELKPLAFELPDQLAHYDLIFFVSAYAVKVFFDNLQQHNISVPLSAYMGAVGRSTAKALLNNGVTKERLIVPKQGSDSEAFINELKKSVSFTELSNEQNPIAADKNHNTKVAQLFISKKPSVLIVRAQSGREVLRRFLESQQCKVKVLSVYQRQPASWSQQSVDQLIQAIRRQEPVVWLLTSREGVDAVVAQWKKYPALLTSCWQHQFHVYHTRIGKRLIEHFLRARNSGLLPDDLPAPNIKIVHPD